MNPPGWQNVSQVVLFAISHLPPKTGIISVDDLEIYTDSLLETVFSNLIGIIQKYGNHTMSVTLHYEKTGDVLLLLLDEQGASIPAEKKNPLLGGGYPDNRGHELLLAKEILSITGITLNETGMKKQGIRFEMLVPKGMYRFFRHHDPPA